MKKNSTLHIIFKNTFTLFNLVNLILAAMVALVGSYKNLLFIFVAIANTMISIVNEVRAKKIVDKMRLIAEQRPTVIRNGKSIQVGAEDVVKGDVLVLSLGDQIMYDSVLIEGTLEVNEAFITGEQDNIIKRQGDRLTSGSFVVSGAAKARVENVGDDNFVNRLQKEATSIKTADSKLFKLMNNIVKYISYALIPIGALLLWSRFRTEPDQATAVTSTVAALINMIPEGLILLTSSVLALATIRLSKKKVLVQDLYSIETLARVDCICLDKTGTLTTGNMTVRDIVLPDTLEILTHFKDSANANTAAEKSLISALEAILSNIPIDNATSRALSLKFVKKASGGPKHENENVEVIPFSSDRKYSGVKIKDTEYLMGALEFMTEEKAFLSQGAKLKGAYRVLAVIKRARGKDSLLGFVRLEDEIRHDAASIVKYFYDNDVSIRIISGDDLETVTRIAERVGISDRKGVDMSKVKDPDYKKLVKDNTIFTRVKPAQKKSLITAFRKQGFTVAMTGDGVNDILAMKEADVSLAIGDGADAARRAAKMVLLGSDFSSIPSIIDEGRQSINNLERSTALFLAKTVYASVLAVVFVFLPFSYPFSPIEMTLLNFTCIGLPGIVLALEKNTERIKNRFTRNIIEYSVPIGLTVSVCMLVLSIISHSNGLVRVELTTASAFVTFAIDLILIYRISRPLNRLRGSLLIGIISIMAIVFLVPLIRNFFEFALLGQEMLLIVLGVILCGFALFELLRAIIHKIELSVFDQTTG